MTGETDQLPFTGYFSYKISDSTSVDTISYDDSTSEKMDGKSTTFEHLYTQWNPAYQPELHVYNTAHPEMQ